MAEHRKPHVWFTMSGVLAATAFPSAEDPGRMEMQMPGDKWPEFHDGEDYNLHEHCQPVRPVIEYLRRLKDQDYSVGLATRAKSNAERASKETWLKNHGLYDCFNLGVRFTFSPLTAVQAAKSAAEANGMTLAECLLVTDDYRLARNAMQRGMPALHIANMIAGMAEPGGNMFPKM